VSASEPERVRVSQGGIEGNVWIGPGLLRTADRFLVSPSGRFLLFSSSAAEAAAAPIRAALGPRLILDRRLDDRETAKTAETAVGLADDALRAGVRRDDAIVAVGGGVVTDIAGFAAAIVLRGVTWNAVPTTTAGMADAAIGGKTGVNHPLGKNLLGAFHPPAAVLVDPAALETLSERDYRAGLVEALKAAWVADAGLAARCSRRLPALLARDEEELLALLSGAVRIKVEIVSADPRDAGRRRLLNFGHTLGHAFEAAGGFERLRHGEAVAWGIAAALEVSRTRSSLPADEADAVRRVLADLGPFPAPQRDPEVLAPLLARDKKTTSEGLVSVLLERIGRARVDETVSAAEWTRAAAIMSLS
jgi:3-dehydroquinate synthase